MSGMNEEAKRKLKLAAKIIGGLLLITCIVLVSIDLDSINQDCKNNVGTFYFLYYLYLLVLNPGFYNSFLIRMFLIRFKSEDLLLSERRPLINVFVCSFSGAVGLTLMLRVDDEAPNCFDGKLHPKGLGWFMLAYAFIHFISYLVFAGIIIFGIITYFRLVFANKVDKVGPNSSKSEDYKHDYINNIEEELKLLTESTTFE